MRKKGIQKRLLAALLAGIMCIGSVQVFPGIVEEVKASEETLAPGERIEKTTLFKSDFEKLTKEGNFKGEEITKEGWTAHSGNGAGGAKNNGVKMGKPGIASDETNMLNLYSDEGWAGPRIIKHINVEGLDNVVVEFDMLMLDGASQSGAPELYVGTIAGDNVTERYFEPNNSNIAHMAQTYWSADESMAGSWKSVKLSFEILDGDEAQVTAYVGTDQDGEARALTLSDGVLNLGFAFRAYSKTINGPWDEAYLDNVHVYTEEVVKTYETTLFESNFDNASITDKNVIGDTELEQYRGTLVNEEGWTAYGDRYYGVSAGGNKAKPKYINIRVKNDTDHTGDKHINIWASGTASNASLVKHITGASDFDKVTVEFDLKLITGSSNDNFYFYVGEVFEDNVWSQYLEDTNQTDNAYMSQVYWERDAKKDGVVDGKVRLEFDILSDDVAEVTTYIGDSTKPDDKPKYIALHDGMLNLALVTRVSNKGGDDEAYLDDVKVTGTKDVRRKAEVETSEKLLFHSDFEATLDDKTGQGNTGYLSTREGWDGEPINLWPHKPADIDGNSTLKLNMFSTKTTSQVGGIYKSVDVKTADKVTVDFKLNMIGGAKGNDLKFAVGSLLKGNNLNYIEQEYWSCDESIGTGWKNVTLEFDMLTDSLAKVTADVAGTKGESKIVVIPDGKLQLGFVANGLKNDGGDNEVYMDDVWVYAEEPVAKESVLTNGAEYTLFKSDFTTTDGDSSMLTKQAGWDAYRRKTGMHVRQMKELNMYIGAKGEELQGIFKRVYTKDADKVIVEFKLRIDAQAKVDNFKFTVGAPEYNNLKKTIEHEYWSCDKSGHTSDNYIDVKLVFEMLTDTSAKVTAYKGVEQDGDAKVVTVQKGLLNLAFVGNVTHNGSKSDEIYMDDVVVTGIKEKHATTVVTESLFDADFETSVSSNGASSLKSEGWDKGSYKFDNDGDGEYDVFPNTDNLNASGTKNSYLSINTDEDGNHSLKLESKNGAATSRIQKIIDVTNLDNFVVEFEYQTSGEVDNGSGWYGEFQLVQDPDYVWVYDDTEEPTLNEDGKSYTVPGEVPQFERPVKGYDAVFNATSEGKMSKARVEFNVETETVHAYTWNDETASWELLEGYECAGLQIKENKVYLTFMYSARNGGYAYLDNVNIYSVKEAVDGCITDVEGNKSYSEPTMLDGAGVRLVDPAGIRFKGRVNKEFIRGLQHVYGEANVEYGVVIAPYDFVDKEFTIDALGDGKYLQIKAEKIAAETEEYYEFNCAIVNIKEKNYGRDYAARTYIQIKTADGTKYAYSDFDSIDNVRSLADVAARALATEKYSGADKTQLEKYDGAAEPLSTGSDIRVMSMNILSERADVSEDYAGIKERAKVLKATIHGYTPAVVGLQEVTKNWLNAINESENQLGDDYVVIQGNYKGGWFGMQTVTNETAIIYDKTQVEIVVGTYGTYTNNYGYITFEQDDKDHTTTWAAMQTKNGEKFLFINAHPSYYKQGEDTEGVLGQQWTQLVEFINTLKATYGEEFGVILVGDFNSGYGNAEYSDAMDLYKETNAGAKLLDGQDAVLAGMSQGGFTCDTMHSVGKHESDLYVAHGGDDAFDHIFICTDTPVQFRKFSVVVDDDVMNLSDHYPLYADIVLNPVQ